MNDSYLAHYGVKGMKWGVRKRQNSADGGGFRPLSKKVGRFKKETVRASKQKRSRAAASKNRRSLSDADLDKRIARLEKEQKLKKLTEQDVAPGRTAVKNFMKSTGGKVLKAAAIGATVYAGKTVMQNKGFKDVKGLKNKGKAFRKSVDYKELGNWMFPNPNKKK